MCNGKRSALATAFGILITVLLHGCAAGLLGSQEKHLPGEYYQSLTINGLTRRYIMYIPTAYNGERPLPLLTAFHGYRSNAREMRSLTGLNEKAEEEDFIVVYPESGGGIFNRSWNAGFCCGDAFFEDIDDVGFVRELMEKLEDALLIDRKRVYITGFSNGGMLTYRLGAELSDMVAAIAPVAASAGGSLAEGWPVQHMPKPSSPVSVIAFHGRQDEQVPFEGGKGRRYDVPVYLSVDDSISFWVKENNCAAVPDTWTSKRGNIGRETYTCEESGVEITLYIIEDGGHAWPVNIKGTWAYDPDEKISATDLIWDFFSRHPKK